MVDGSKVNSSTPLRFLVVSIVYCFQIHRQGREFTHILVSSDIQNDEGGLGWSKGPESKGILQGRGYW